MNSILDLQPLPPGEQINFNPSPFGSRERARLQMNIKREMTITHADFFRLLPSLFEDRFFRRDDLSIFSNLGDGSMEIKLGPEQNKRLGSLDLMVTEITFHFTNVGESDRRIFLEKLDQVYQKGGG